MRFYCFAISLLVLIFVIIYCEFLIYYTTLLQCDWPQIHTESLSSKTNYTNIMFISDIHLSPNTLSHYLDGSRHEWQMYRSFRTALQLFRPQFIFILGDLFDDGENANDMQFQTYVNRFKNLFSVETKSPNLKSKLYAINGNHDIGFHYTMTHKLKTRFDRALETDSVELININGINFVTINSITMEGDYCQLCSDAEQKLLDIGKKLCSNSKCDEKSKPILLTHFPLFRKSDKDCDEVDSAPNSLKFDIFKEKWDCLSNNATKLIMNTLKPKLIITGHTHYGCMTLHPNNVQEWTLSSFNYKNIRTPSLLLVQFSKTNYYIRKCILPNEITIYTIYLFTLIILAFFWFPYIRRLIRKIQFHFI